jgi:hypothetical protein
MSLVHVWPTATHDTASFAASGHPKGPFCHLAYLYDAPSRDVQDHAKIGWCCPTGDGTPSSTRGRARPRLFCRSVYRVRAYHTRAYFFWR